MQNKHKLLGAVVLMASSTTQSYAELANGSILNFEPGVVTSSPYGSTFVKSGSYFGMDTNGNNAVTANERTALTQNDGIILGTAQSASGSHSGAPNGSEIEGIGKAWGFFGNTGLHYTSTAANVLTATGNTATVDLSGWVVTWNFIDPIPMSSRAWEAGFTDGVAQITCGFDCADGDTYTLNYSATVPDGDPSGFGNVKYTLRYVGTITVPNTPPTVSNSIITVNAGGTGTVDVTSTGDDPDGDNANLVAVSLVPGLNGALSGENTGTITYTNTNTSATSDTFTYKVNDGTDDSLASATVSVTINAIPVANADSASTTPGSTITINLLSNDTDEDGNGTIDATSVIEDGSISNGTISINTSTGVATYINDGTTGTDTFSYTVDDDNGATSNSALVSIDVQADPAPTCNGTTLTLNQDTSSVLTVSNFATAGDVSKTLDYSTIATSTPSNGGISINTTTGVITYTPTAGYFGSDLFTYTINDNTKTCVAATINVNVNSTNTTPVTNADSISTNTGTAVNIDVTSNDTDDDAITNSTITITNAPSNGTAVVSSGMITYTPSTGFSGSDNFTYTLTDVESAQSLNATVTITVVATVPSATAGSVTPGNTASGAGSTTGRIASTDLTVIDEGDTAKQGIESSCIGGCFDFIVSGLSNGGTTQVVLPLTATIPTPAEGHSYTYRKLNIATSTWSTFDTSGDNAIHSADGTISGSTTSCPAADDTVYDSSPNITIGHECIRLTIVDGGPNDDDGLANGTVVDPGGVAESFFIDTRTSGTDGCSMTGTTRNANNHADWWLVSAFIGLLGWFSLKRKQA